MSNGVLCFANNNGKVDYLKQAIFLARRVKKHLGVPISLATANKRDFDYMYSDQRELFDKIIENLVLIIVFGVLIIGTFVMVYSSNKMNQMYFDSPIIETNTDKIA